MSRRSGLGAAVALITCTWAFQGYAQAEASFSRPQAGIDSTLPAFIGAYLWSGMPDNERSHRSLAKARTILAGAGLKAIRIVISPQAFSLYGIDEKPCLPRPDAACVLRSQPIQDLLADPRLPVVALTLHEFVMANWRMADRSYVAAYEADLEAEDNAALAAILPVLIANPEKIIIIANREGDHGVFCGSTLSFVTSPEHRADCLGEVSAGRSPSLERRKDALVAWFTVRQRAIGRFRARHGLEGRLFHAVEFNTVQRMKDLARALAVDLPTVLHDIVPQVAPDMCSYSAYSSFNGGYSLAADLQTIASICGRRPIILGELGFSSSGRTPEAVRQLYDRALSSAAAAKVRGVFIWQGFEAPGQKKKYGLFQADGAPLQFNLIAQSRVTR